MPGNVVFFMCTTVFVISEFVIAWHLKKIKVMTCTLMVGCPVIHDFSYHYLIKVHSRTLRSN